MLLFYNFPFIFKASIFVINLLILVEDVGGCWMLILPWIDVRYFVCGKWIGIPPLLWFIAFTWAQCQKARKKYWMEEARPFIYRIVIKKSKVSWKKSHFSPLKFSTRFSISHEIGWQIDVWENIVRLPYWGRLSCFPDNGRRSFFRSFTLDPPNQLLCYGYQCFCR